MDALRALADRWREHAALLHRYGHATTAKACELHADEVEAAIAEVGSKELTLRQASAESGYSADHLGRLVRDGTIPNAGRPNAPKIRRSDLPLKATSLRNGSRGPHVGPVDRRQIARSIVEGKETDDGT